MSDPDNAFFWALPEALAWGQLRDPPDSFYDFLRTLHELCSSGRVHVIGGRPACHPRDALVPIPASDWGELYFDSDGEQLRSGDLFSGILDRRRAWTSVRFSQADLVREWPKTGASAFVEELAEKHREDRFRARGERRVRERWRQGWIDRFAAKQRQVRRWISFIEIADMCARAAFPNSIEAEAQARAVAYRRLTELTWRGEFERNGRSQVLLLLPHLVSPAPPHRLTHELFRDLLGIYGTEDFSADSRLVRDSFWYCWLPHELCRQWFARHGLAWPNAFDPDSTDSAIEGSFLPGPKGGEKKPARLAWEIAERILGGQDKPPRGHGRLTALARQVKPLLEYRGHKRKAETITKYIRAAFRDWENKIPDE